MHPITSNCSIVHDHVHHWNGHNMGAQPPLGLLLPQIIHHKSPILRAFLVPTPRPTNPMQSPYLMGSHGISWGWKSWGNPWPSSCARTPWEVRGHELCEAPHHAGSLWPARRREVWAPWRFTRHWAWKLPRFFAGSEVGDKFEHVPHISTIHELLIYIALPQSQLQGDEISIWKPLHFHLKDLCSLHPPRPFLSCLSPWGLPHAHPVRWSEWRAHKYQHQEKDIAKKDPDHPRYEKDQELQWINYIYTYIYIYTNYTYI